MDPIFSQQNIVKKTPNEGQNVEKKLEIKT